MNINSKKQLLTKISADKNINSKKQWVSENRSISGSVILTIIRGRQKCIIIKKRNSKVFLFV